MVCICILGTSLSIYGCVSDRVHLGSSSTSNLFFFLFFKLKNPRRFFHIHMCLQKLKYSYITIVNLLANL